MSSIKEVAKHAGISPASVSIYLNNKETNRVSSKTKSRIELAVKELNYHKNIFASSLTTRESKLIGIVIPTILPLFQNDYTNALLSGIQTRLSAFGYGLLFFPSSAQSSIEIVKEQLEKSAGCDGYILFSTGFCTMKQISKNIEEISKTQRPFVTLNIPRVDKQVNQVLLEDLDITNGVRHLIEKGHRRLLLVLGRQGGEHMRYLRNDFHKLLNQHNLEFNEEHILYGNYSADTTYTAVKSALRKYPDTTGICCMSDIMASSTIKAIQDAGKSVPGDISVIGRNNSLYSRLSSPALSTIDLHMHEAGLGAANLILNTLSGNSVSQKILFSGTLIERDSVKTITKEK
jgi:LacI family transcriptional regulator, galactose operon repressor